MRGAHQAKRKAVREWVRQDRVRLCEMQSCCEARHVCIGFCWSGGGVLEGAVEYELGCSAEAAQDMSKGGEKGAGDVRKDEGKGDG